MIYHTWSGKLISGARSTNRTFSRSGLICSPIHHDGLLEEKELEDRVQHLSAAQSNVAFGQANEHWQIQLVTPMWRFDMAQHLRLPVILGNRTVWSPAQHDGNGGVSSTEITVLINQIACNRLAQPAIASNSSWAYQSPESTVTADFSCRRESKIENGLFSAQQSLYFAWRYLSRPVSRLSPLNVFRSFWISLLKPSHLQFPRSWRSKKHNERNHSGKSRLCSAKSI